MTLPAASGPVDIVVVDNLDVVRRGLISLPISHPDAIASVRTCAAIEDLDFSATPPHVVVLDLWLGRDDRSSIAHIERLHEWGALVVLYTTEERPHPLQLALAADLDGLCLKNDGVDSLVAAILRVARGERGLSSPLARALLQDDALGARLTETEIETLRALSYGKSPPQIAALRHVATSTVNTHIEHIRAKYAETRGVRVNRSRMIDEGRRDGYVDPRFVDEDPESL